MTTPISMTSLYMRTSSAARLRGAVLLLCLSIATSAAQRRSGTALRQLVRGLPAPDHAAHSQRERRHRRLVLVHDGHRYSTEIIQRFQAGVPVRVILDLRADANYPSNATIRQSSSTPAFPIRHKTTAGINHWKMMLYAGQAKMHFSAANFAERLVFADRRRTHDYVDEAIYFTDDPAIVTAS